MRLLLADDDRQRYSVWYRDYGTLQTSSDGTLVASSDSSSQSPQVALTRSQQLLQHSTSTNNNNNLINSIAPIVDLQIALLTPTGARPMQVRLTRRNQCSELRGYMNQGAYGSSMSAVSSSSMPSYASSATASSASSSITFMSLALSSYSSIVTIIWLMQLTKMVLSRRHSNISF